MSVHLTQLERTAARILADLRRLEQISVPSAAKLLHKPKRWVRANLPVVVMGPKSHSVRASDIEAFLQRRTVQPLNGKELI